MPCMSIAQTCPVLFMLTIASGVQKKNADSGNDADDLIY